MPENYGFVYMSSVRYSHVIAQLLENKRPKGAKIILTPKPEDIVNRISPTFGVTCSLLSSQIWENLNKSPAKLIIRKTIGWALLTILIILSLPPLFGISFLVNAFFVRVIFLLPDFRVPLSYAKYSGLIPFLDSWAQYSPGTFNYISGLLPPIAYKLFDSFFMAMVFRLSRYQGSATGSSLQSSILARYFAFSVISELIIFTLIGATFSTCCIILAFGCSL
jgi:calcium permeable stress-gated cation channel